MMRFDLVTIFPDFFRGPLDYGVVARAARSGTIAVAVHDLRGWAEGPHRITDDRPFGGGEGMVMKPEPIAACLDTLAGGAARPHASGVWVVLLSAQGRRFDQAAARRLAAYDRLILLCGRYEGVDERVAEYMADEELAVGDFVLSGGELAAAMVLDAVARLQPGVLGDAQSARNESFPESAADGSATAPGAPLLDCPHYTRPAEFRGWGTPEVLRGGDHAAIARWRREAAGEKTRRNRPDLLAGERPGG
ncbi:MAG: tRNA (guanosine(37)-N1)-methyltransferase TrmD [Terriglobales bacterium]